MTRKFTQAVRYWLETVGYIRENSPAWFVQQEMRKLESKNHFSDDMDILLIKRDVVFSDLVESSFNQADLTVVDDIDQVKNLFSDRQYDVIVTDCFVVEEAFDTIIESVVEAGATTSTPILIWGSGKGRTDFSNRFKNVEFIDKPVRTDVIRKTIMSSFLRRGR